MFQITKSNSEKLEDTRSLVVCVILNQLLCVSFIRKEQERDPVNKCYVIM